MKIDLCRIINRGTDGDFQRENVISSKCFRRKVLKWGLEMEPGPAYLFIISYVK